MIEQRIFFKEDAKEDCAAVASTLSLAPLLRKLEADIALLSPQEGVLAAVVLERFQYFAVQKICLTDVNQQDCLALFSLLYGYHKGSTARSNSWAVLDPGISQTLYGTDDLFELIDIILEQQDQQGFKDWRLRSLYALVLHRFYGYPKNVEQHFVYTDRLTEAPFRKHTAWELDFSYMDVQFLGTELPSLNYSKIIASTDIMNIKMEVMEELLPLEDFHFEGFALLEAEDISETVELEQMKEFSATINGTTRRESYNEILGNIRSILRNDNIKFSFMPLFEQASLQHLLIDELTEHSVYFTMAVHHGIHGVEAYKENPSLVLYQVMGTQDSIAPYFVDYIREQGISSYCCIPLFHKGSVSGVFEIYTVNGHQLDELVTVKLRNISDILAQITYELSLELNNRINKLIMDKYTLIQPAVEWKFREAAVKYIRAKDILQLEKPVIGDIVLQQVVPLYGAIDIRNSTQIRNIAVLKDMHIYMDALDRLIGSLRAEFPFMQHAEILNATQYWRDKLSAGLLEQVFVRLMDFCTKDVPQFLTFFKQGSTAAQVAVQEFESCVDPLDGEAYQHRRAIEGSIQLLNKVISEELEALNHCINALTPCYFDKFRTDGIEFDIYLGESIAPSRKMSAQDIQKARFEQLKAMVLIAQKTALLREKLPYPLETTYLIYVNSSTIDVSFRADERRFDVEGAYNVRYQLVKKRIDKITLKGSYDRLTQPFQIALVYSSEDMHTEYMSYITALQYQGIISSRVEQLMLEDVQGISGLKALRFQA